MIDLVVIRELGAFRHQYFFVAGYMEWFFELGLILELKGPEHLCIWGSASCTNLIDCD